MLGEERRRESGCEMNFVCESAVLCHKDQGHVVLSKNSKQLNHRMQSGFKDIRFKSPSFHGATEIGASKMTCLASLSFRSVFQMVL